MTGHIEDLLHEFINHSSENGDLTHLTDHISVGFVVNNDDPLQQGRLQIFCPSYNDDPKKLLHLPWSAYVTPVGGVVSQDAYARGHIAGSESSAGAVHYGFWAIPEIGAHCLVACINGDPRRRVWLGCLPSHQETHTLPHGRFKHANGSVDGPLTSEGQPIQPTYGKMQEAFAGETDSAEWKTRGPDYQTTAILDVPSPDKSVYVDDDNTTISGNETDEWVKGILGDNGYDWSGYKNLGSFLASRVQSWTTPGFHSISMDDRPFNSRIRVRTTGGNQIILDDTNERIHVSTSGGKSWVEMDAAGNIDVYGERNLSFHADKNLNFSAGESIRLKSDGFISMYAGTTGGQTPLDSPVAPGQIRIHTADDLHVTSDTNLRFKVAESMLGNIGTNLDLDVLGQVNVQVGGQTYWESVGNIRFESPNVEWNVSSKDTSVNDLTAYLDELVGEINTHISVYEGHTHPYTWTDPSGASDTSAPSQQSQDTTEINGEGYSPNPVPTLDETFIAPWTNRKPQHEPWPRVMMIDAADGVNTMSNGPVNNVDWVEQYDNVGVAGREPIGKVEGQDTIDRGQFWRR